MGTAEAAKLEVVGWGSGLTAIPGLGVIRVLLSRDLTCNGAKVNTHEGEIRLGTDGPLRERAVVS